MKKNKQQPDNNETNWPDAAVLITMWLCFAFIVHSCSNI